MEKTCNTCKYYNITQGWCNYYCDEVPFKLNNSCQVWTSKELTYLQENRLCICLLVILFGLMMMLVIYIGITS